MPQWPVVYRIDSCSGDIGGSENHDLENSLGGGGTKPLLAHRLYFVSICNRITIFARNNKQTFARLIVVYLPAHAEILSNVIPII